MVLLAHILIALASVGYASYLVVAPSPARFRVAYTLVAFTLVTGSYLVWMAPAHMVQACTTGLLYLGVVGAVIGSAHYKMAHTK